MQITIQRDTKRETFPIERSKAVTLLAAFYEIKSKIDPSLTFGAGCRSGVCGSCAVLVNGREQLACSYRHQEGDLIAPLRYHPLLRDLKVDKSRAHNTLQDIVGAPLMGTLPEKTDTPSHTKELPVSTPEDEAKTRMQTDCILCDSCYSACPVLAVNPNFLGPFALTRAWRYIAASPPKEVFQSNASQHSSLLDSVQINGIWDCTLCGECTVACPQGIDPKTDILMLRGESGKAGYTDPHSGAMDFGTPNFGAPDFGGGFS